MGIPGKTTHLHHRDDDTLVPREKATESTPLGYGKEPRPVGMLTNGARPQESLSRPSSSTTSLSSALSSADSSTLTTPTENPFSEVPTSTQDIHANDGRNKPRYNQEQRTREKSSKSTEHTHRGSPPQQQLSSASVEPLLPDYENEPEEASDSEDLAQASAGIDDMELINRLQDGSFTCPECNKSFQTSFTLKRHLKNPNIHPKTQATARPSRTRCHFCHSTFSTRGNRNKHEREKHNARRCTQCDHFCINDHDKPALSPNAYTCRCVRRRGRNTAVPSFVQPPLPTTTAAALAHGHGQLFNPQLLSQQPPPPPPPATGLSNAEQLAPPSLFWPPPNQPFDQNGRQQSDAGIRTSGALVDKPTAALAHRRSDGVGLDGLGSSRLIPMQDSLATVSLHQHQGDAHQITSQRSQQLLPTQSAHNLHLSGVQTQRNLLVGGATTASNSTPFVTTPQPLPQPQLQLPSSQVHLFQQPHRAQPSGTHLLHTLPPTARHHQHNPHQLATGQQQTPQHVLMYMRNAQGHQGSAQQPSDLQMNSSLSQHAMRMIYNYRQQQHAQQLRRQRDKKR